MPVFKVFAVANGAPIQGIGFRELVEQTALSAEPMVVGQAKNRKREEDVEIQAFFGTEQEFSVFLEKIREKAKKKIGINVQYVGMVTSESSAFFSKGFEVVREDELKEMFWALNGAKKEFNELHKETQLAKKRREELMLEGLEAELKKLKEVFAPEPKKALAEYTWFAVSRFLTEPFNPEVGIILTDLNSALQEAHEYKSRKKEEFGTLLEKINQLIDQARSTIKEQITNTNAAIAEEEKA